MMPAPPTCVRVGMWTVEGWVRHCQSGTAGCAQQGLQVLQKARQWRYAISSPAPVGDSRPAAGAAAGAAGKLPPCGSRSDPQTLHLPQPPLLPVHTPCLLSRQPLPPRPQHPVFRRRCVPPQRQWQPTGAGGTERRAPLPHSPAQAGVQAYARRPLHYIVRMHLIQQG